MIEMRERSRRFVVVPEKPDQPPEGRLLEEALASRRPHMTQREAARRAGISDARWRQLVTGYQSVGQGHYAPVTARAETLARMAGAVGVTPEQLVEVDREDAAAILMRINREGRTPDRDLPVDADVDPLDLSDLTVEEIDAVKAVIRALRTRRPGES